MNRSLSEWIVFLLSVGFVGFFVIDRWRLWGVLWRGLIRCSKAGVAVALVFITVYGIAILLSFGLEEFLEWVRKIRRERLGKAKQLKMSANRMLGPEPSPDTPEARVYLERSMKALRESEKRIAQWEAEQAALRLAEEKERELAKAANVEALKAKVLKGFQQ